MTLGRIYIIAHLWMYSILFLHNNVLSSELIDKIMPKKAHLKYHQNKHRHDEDGFLKGPPSQDYRSE